MSDAEGRLPEGWKTVRLGDYCHKPKYGYTASATKEQVGPKFLRITDIQNGAVDWETVPFCKLDDKFNESYYLKPGDIVIARIGATTGKAYLIRDCPKVIFASYMIRVRTKNKLLPEFLNQFLQKSSYWDQINQSKGGRLKGGINIPFLKNLKLYLPPLPEQRAIARALRSVQAAMEARRRELALERERKAALMEYLFTHGTRGEPLKETEVGVMPEGWEVVRLGEIVTLRRGKDLPLRQRIEGSIPVIGSNGIVGTHKRSPEGIQIPGITVGRSGSVGELTYQPKEYWPLNTVLYALNFHGNHPKFVYYWLHQFDFKRYAQGVSVPTLNRNLIHPVELPLPPLDEQKELAVLLSQFDTKLKRIQSEISTLDELFRAMLEELMTGRLSARALIKEYIRSPSESRNLQQGE